jgi:hypothetical protein
MIDNSQYSLSVFFVKVKFFIDIFVVSLHFILEPQIKVAVLCLLGTAKSNNAISHIF